MSDHTLAGKSASVSSRRSAAKQKTGLGSYYSQQFYAVRHAPGKALALPFPARPFHAMIHTAGPLPDRATRQLGLELLRSGMRYALCHGSDAAKVGDVLDELIDANHFSFEGHTPYTSVHAEESLAEAIEYFILPAGLAETGLLIVVGEEDAFRGALREFNQITAHLRERSFSE